MYLTIYAIHLAICAIHVAICAGRPIRHLDTHQCMIPDTHLYTALQAIILAHTSIDTTLRDVLTHRHTETGEA